MKLRAILVRLLAGIGALALLIVGIGGFQFWSWMNEPVTAPKAPENMVLQLDFTRPVVEERQELSLSIEALFAQEEETPVMDVVRALDRAKGDPRVKGVVARMGAEVPNLVYVQEIRDALHRFKESGKFTFVYAPSYGGFGTGNRAYYLASAFQNIWLQPVGTVGLTGLGIETPFGKTALNKLGIDTDFLRREEYKSVMENVTRDDFSPAVRANMESMLKNLSEQLVTGIAESRNATPAKVREWMARGPYTGPEALDEGLITRIGYANEMLTLAETLATEMVTLTKTRAPVSVSPTAYLNYEYKLPDPKGTVALINATGIITDSSVGPSTISGEHIIDTDEIVDAFAQASEDINVDAILFRVNSPGGSPEASETIRNAVVRAQKAKKPVFISMGDVAASGGYWIAMNGDHIVAEPGTITGSIGVVAGKFVIDGLSKKLGIAWDGMETSDNAKMWSVTRPFSSRDRERMNALLDYTYGAFVENVAQARKIPMEKMQDIAKGRVWTGFQAINVGLVDELGGLQTTVAAIKKHLDLKPTDTLQIKQFPPPITPATIVLKLLKNLGLELALVRTGLGALSQAQEALGPLWSELAATRHVNAIIPSVYRDAVK